ncbi:MAG: zinc ribbon domain-containing protein [Oscillospiraceae bacterium]|nr:zinc ribbon domain-containing protein [Oscillospiraceae bacterium]
MAYCDRCGAYVPDGWTSCPACGYDKEKEEKMRAAAQAQAAREESARSELEEAERRRAERRENDRIWAERERQRREREQEELHRRQQEQEERNRREQERLRREKSEGGVHVEVNPDGTKNIKIGDAVHVVVNADGTKNIKIGGTVHEVDDSDSDDKTERGFEQAAEKLRDFVNSDAANKAQKEFELAGEKILPILSYIGPLFLLPLLLGNDDFTKFHARQGLRLFIWSAILTGVGSWFHIGWAVSVFSLFMAFIGIKNVLNNKKEPLPYIGK